MSSVEVVCTGCSCLCDDIKVDISDQRISRIENACLRGSSLISASTNPKRRSSFLVERRQVSPEEAIDSAAQLLKRARRPFIFGLDDCTVEAQEVGIALAQALRATMDDVSSFSHGILVEGILQGNIPTCSFPEVQKANLLVYWGSNPYQSHPRHLSKFTYYCREKFEETGWKPAGVVLGCVEVRDTELTIISDLIFKLKPGEDATFIQEVLATLRGKEGSERARNFVEAAGKSAHSIFFAGLGLIYGLDNELALFYEMLTELNRRTRFSVIPMVGHFNTVGLNRLLYEKTGYINRVSFGDGIAHKEEFSFLEQVRKRIPDCVLIVGSDPWSSQPSSLMKNLEGIPVICLDPFLTSTTMAATVVLATALSGFEAEGKAIRMDGTVVPLSRGRESALPSDARVLAYLLERVK